MRRWLFVAILVVAGLLLGSYGPSAFDVSALRMVSSFRTPVLNDTFVILTTLGLAPVAFIFSVVVWRRSRAAAIRLAVAAGGAWCIGEIMKQVIERPRPGVVPKLVDARGFSFPSGHALVAAATFTTLAFIIYREQHSRARRILVIAGAVLTIGLVAFSRVYLGVHYASDTIGGILLGTAWALILLTLTRISHQETWSKDETL